MFYKTFSREASPEAAATLKVTVAVELRDDGGYKFSGNHNGEKVWIWDIFKLSISPIH